MHYMRNSWFGWGGIFVQTCQDDGAQLCHAVTDATVIHWNQQSVGQSTLHQNYTNTLRQSTRAVHDLKIFQLCQACLSITSSVSSVSDLWRHFQDKHKVTQPFIKIWKIPTDCNQECAFSIWLKPGFSSKNQHSTNDRGHRMALRHEGRGHTSQMRPSTNSTSWSKTGSKAFPQETIFGNGEP